MDHRANIEQQIAECEIQIGIVDRQRYSPTNDAILWLLRQELRRLQGKQRRGGPSKSQHPYTGEWSEHGPS